MWERFFYTKQRNSIATLREQQGATSAKTLTVTHFSKNNQNSIQKVQHPSQEKEELYHFLKEHQIW